MSLIYELSDIHAEHWRDPNAFIKFLEYIRPIEIADVLVLAGDIWSLRDRTCLLYLDEFRKWAIEIVYVPGNHEWFDTSVTPQGKETLTALHDEGLRVLGPDYYESFTYEGMRFVGSTLWYPDNPLVRKKLMDWCDQAFIRGFTKWWEKYQLLERQHLWNNIQEGDIVVTHMLPSWNCVSERFVADPYTCMFVSPMEDLILEKKPKIWFHGHTHDPVDITLGDTKILCNPIGYPSAILINQPETVKILEIRL